MRALIPIVPCHWVPFQPTEHVEFWKYISAVVFYSVESCFAGLLMDAMDIGIRTWEVEAVLMCVWVLGCGGLLIPG